MEVAFLFDCAKYLTKTYTQGKKKLVQYGKIKWNEIKEKEVNNLFYKIFLLTNFCLGKQDSTQSMFLHGNNFV